jgi:hypothetical protein
MFLSILGWLMFSSTKDDAVKRRRYGLSTVYTRK